MFRGRTLLVLLTIGCFRSSVRPYEGVVLPPFNDGLTKGPMAVVPVRLPDDLEAPDEVADAIDSLVAATLVDAGISIVPSARYSAIWQRLVEEAGGFYDPFTGRRDETKYDSAVTTLYRELDSLHAPTAWVYPEVWIVEAEVANGVAHWDGVAQRAGGAWFTTILALTFEVSVEDTSGVAIFKNGKGLELYERVDAQGDIEPMPRGLMFQNAARLSLVVRDVLGPLVALADTTS